MQAVARLLPPLAAKLKPSSSTTTNAPTVRGGWGELADVNWVLAPAQAWRRREQLFHYWEKVRKALPPLRVIHDYYQSVGAQSVQFRAGPTNEALKAFFDYSSFATYEDPKAPIIRHYVGHPQESRRAPEVLPTLDAGTQPPTVEEQGVRLYAPDSIPSRAGSPDESIGEIRLTVMNPSDYGVCLSYAAPTDEASKISANNPVFLPPRGVPVTVTIRAPYEELTKDNSRLVFGIGNCADTEREHVRLRLIAFRLGETNPIPAQPKYTCPKGAEWKLTDKNVWECQCPPMQPVATPKVPSERWKVAARRPTTTSVKAPFQMTGYHLDCKPSKEVIDQFRARQSKGGVDLGKMLEMNPACVQEMSQLFTSQDKPGTTPTPSKDPWLDLSSKSPAERALALLAGSGTPTPIPTQRSDADFQRIADLMQCVSNVCDLENTIFTDAERSECEECGDGLKADAFRTQCVEEEDGGNEDDGSGGCPSCATLQPMFANGGYGEYAGSICVPNDGWQVLDGDSCGPLDCGTNATQAQAIEWGLEGSTATILNKDTVCDCKAGHRVKDGTCQPYTPCEEYANTEAKDKGDGTYDCECIEDYYQPEGLDGCAPTPSCPEGEYFNFESEECDEKCPGGTEVEPGKCCPSGSTYRDGKCYIDAAALHEFSPSVMLASLGSAALNTIDPFPAAYAQEQEEQPTEVPTEAPPEQPTVSPTEVIVDDTPVVVDDTPVVDPTATPVDSPSPIPTDTVPPTATPGGTDPSPALTSQPSGAVVGTSPEDGSSTEHPEPPQPSFSGSSPGGGTTGGTGTTQPGGAGTGGGTPGGRSRPRGIAPQDATTSGAPTTTKNGEPILNADEAAQVAELLRSTWDKASTGTVEDPSNPVVLARMMMEQAAQDLIQVLEEGPSFTGEASGIITGNSFQQKVENARQALQTAKIALVNEVTQALDRTGASDEVHAQVKDPIFQAFRDLNRLIANLEAVQGASFNQAVGALAAVKTAVDAALAATASVTAAAAGGKNPLLNGLAARSAFVAVEEAKIISGHAIDNSDNKDGAAAGTMDTLEASGKSILEQSDEIEFQGAMVGVLVAVLTEGMQAGAPSAALGSTEAILGTTVQMISQAASAGLITSEMAQLLQQAADAIAKIAAYLNGSSEVSGKDVAKALVNLGLDTADFGTLSNILSKAGLTKAASRVDEIPAVSGKEGNNTDIPPERNIDPPPSFDPSTLNGENRKLGYDRSSPMFDSNGLYVGKGGAETVDSVNASMARQYQYLPGLAHELSKLPEPPKFYHGSSSSSLTGFLGKDPSQSGQLRPSGKIETEGGAVFSGEIVFGKSNDSISVVDGRYIDVTSGYANGGKWSPEIAQRSIKEAEDGKKLAQEKATREGYGERFKDSYRAKAYENTIATENARLNAWESLSPQQKALISDQFPIVYGIDTTRPGSLDMNPGSDIRGELLLFGGTQGNEIKAVFVPKDKIPYVKGILSSRPEIAVLDIELLKQNSPLNTPTEPNTSGPLLKGGVDTSTIGDGPISRGDPALPSSILQAVELMPRSAYNIGDQTGLRERFSQLRARYDDIGSVDTQGLSPTERSEHLKQSMLITVDLKQALTDTAQKLSEVGIESRLVDSMDGKPFLELQGGGATRLGRVVAAAQNKFRAITEGKELTFRFDFFRNVDARADGMYNSGRNTISLSLDAAINPDALNGTTLHELAHAFRDAKIEKAAKLREANRLSDVVAEHDPYFGTIMTNKAISPRNEGTRLYPTQSLDEVPAWRTNTAVALANLRSATKDGNDQKIQEASQIFIAEWNTAFHLVIRTMQVNEDIQSILSGRRMTESLESSFWFAPERSAYNAKGEPIVLRSFGQVTFQRSDHLPVNEAYITIATEQQGRPLDQNSILIPLIESTSISGQSYDTNMKLLREQLDRLTEQLRAELRSLELLKKNFQELPKQP